MNSLDYLKMIGDNLVLTGFRDKYNLLVDRTIYDVSAELNSTAGTILHFYTNLDVIDVIVPVSLASLTDIQFTNPQAGQTIIFNGTNWVNSYPALATLSDVTLTNPQPKDVLLYNGTNWVNGISENNDYTSTIFINDGDSYTTTISTLDEILGLLAPPKPGNLSTKSLTINPIYTTTPLSVIQTKTGIARTYITDDTTPIIEITPYTATPASTNNGAYNAASGILNSILTVDEASSTPTYFTTAGITFTTGDESGQSNTDFDSSHTLTVTNDFDYHFGVVGKQGFWKAFLSRVQILTPLPYYPTEQHRISMTHSLTGTTNLSFYIDNPQTPSITNLLISTTAVAPQPRHISGVPSLSTGDTINSQFVLHDAIKTFYNSRIANVTSAWTTTVDAIESGIKTYNTDYNANIDVIAQTGKYTENIILTESGYNSKHQTLSTGNFAQTTGTIATTQVGKTMRIDTVSNETIRKTSSTGLYPSSGYGSTFDSTKNIKTDSGYTEELLLINGLFKFPAQNFTTNWPEAGPDYSTGMTSSSGYRWVTFDLGSHSNVPAVRFGFNTATGFTFDTLTTKILDNMKVYVKCGSATAWLDGNAAFNSGTFNVSTNGSGALDIGGSLNGTTNRRVTFGGTVSGNIYVRIGIANGITGISFASITELPL